MFSILIIVAQRRRFYKRGRTGRCFLFSYCLLSSNRVTPGCIGTVTARPSWCSGLLMRFYLHMNKPDFVFFTPFEQGCSLCSFYFAEFYCHNFIAVTPDVWTGEGKRGAALGSSKISLPQNIPLSPIPGFCPARRKRRQQDRNRGCCLSPAKSSGDRYRLLLLLRAYVYLQMK